MKNKELIQKVMKKIEGEEIKMKPKWWFWIINRTMKGLILVGILLASILLSITIYLTSTRTPLELWDYGSLGMEIFFKDFPYLWLISGIVLIGGTGILLSKIGDNYKKTTRIFLVITILFVLLATAIMRLIRLEFFF